MLPFPQAQSLTSNGGQGGKGLGYCLPPPNWLANAGTGVSVVQFWSTYVLTIAPLLLMCPAVTSCGKSLILHPLCDLIAADWLFRWSRAVESQGGQGHRSVGLQQTHCSLVSSNRAAQVIPLLLWNQSPSIDVPSRRCHPFNTWGQGLRQEDGLLCHGKNVCWSWWGCEISPEEIVVYCIDSLSRTCRQGALDCQKPQQQGHLTDR